MMCASWASPRTTPETAQLTSAVGRRCWNTSAVWLASSAVGCMMAEIATPPSACKWCCTMGRAKVKVFPVPVCPNTSTSSPRKAAGRAAACTALGQLNPKRCNCASSTGCTTPHSSKEVEGANQAAVDMVRNLPTECRARIMAAACTYEASESLSRTEGECNVRTVTGVLLWVGFRTAVCLGNPIYEKCEGGLVPKGLRCATEWDMKQI